DYDPGATKVNQENRIKLMLAVAQERLVGMEGVGYVEEEQQDTLLGETIAVGY
ncbi:MAG: 2-hydroxyglutaryl-CoA dehydratase, partial [Angelakisella sp.]|nr:2-hydroxyglutaryl-CoA dehydratase [Angelakisella sp.]